MKKVFSILVGILLLYPTFLPGSEDLGAEEGTQKWVFETGGSVVSSPTIGSDGTIYVGSNDGNLYAVDRNGRLKWRFPTGGAVHSRPAIGGDGTIYIGSFDQYLYAINPQGGLKWRFPTKGEINSSPIIAHDGTIYVGSHDHHLYAINPDGRVKWTFTTGGELFSSPILGSDGTIYMASWDHRLYAINTSPLNTPAAKKTAQKKRSADAPVTGTSPEIKNITVEITTDGEEKVIFRINNFRNPRIFTLDGGRPRLVCDFSGARLDSDIGNRIKVNGHIIRKIRTAFHRGSKSKVRVVMDLVSNGNYQTEHVLLKGENLFTIIFRPKN